MNPSSEQAEASGRVAVLVEIIVAGGHESSSILLMVEKALADLGFRLDKEYPPVPLTPSPEQVMLLEGGRKELRLVRGEVPRVQVKKLEKVEGVVKVWPDTRIEPFQGF